MAARRYWWTGPMLIGGTGALLYWLEHRRPLRRQTESKTRRDLRNLAVAALSAATIRAVEQPIVGPLAEVVEQRCWGLFGILRLPRCLQFPLALAAMDYTLFLWHMLAHRVPLLWRFHQVHHVDLDMDASTALRFHFGEMVLSVPWRAAQVLMLGISPGVLSVWQTLTLMEVLFHHSDVDLPVEVERWLARVIVTPRMHGIHHSIVEAETNSNWSSGLSLWDWLHGTFRLDVPQEQIVIGVPVYRKPEEVVLPKILVMPFGKQRPNWEPRVYLSGIRIRSAGDGAKSAGGSSAGG